MNLLITKHRHISGIFLTTSILLTQMFFAYGQQKDTPDFPEIGKPMPDFVLQNIAYYPKKKASLIDFRGKWLILDFWNKYCEACIAAFPTTSTIQKKLGEKVQVMMVGIQDPQNQIQQLYSRFRKKENLVMPCAFDSLIAQRFDIYVAPHILLIDDKGIVRCITNSINANDVQEFLDGKTPDLPKTYHRMSDSLESEKDDLINFDESKLFLIGGNGAAETDFLFRSVLSKWNRKKHGYYAPPKVDQSAASKGKFQVLGVNLGWLYDYAYFGQECSNNGWSPKDTVHYGKYYATPILEISDSSQFKYSYKYSKNIFSYSLCMPPVKNRTIKSVEAVMQRDLENYFGYQASIEIRQCPYWRLISKKGAHEKLKSKGGDSVWNGVPHSGFVAKNWLYSDISDWLKDQIKGYLSDETGISGKIDLTLDCIPSDVRDLKKALLANDLDLVQDEKEMKVLVIRDKITD